MFFYNILLIFIKHEKATPEDPLEDTPEDNPENIRRTIRRTTGGQPIGQHEGQPGEYPCVRITRNLNQNRNILICSNEPRRVTFAINFFG